MVFSWLGEGWLLYACYSHATITTTTTAETPRTMRPNVPPIIAADGSISDSAKSDLSMVLFPVVGVLFASVIEIYTGQFWRQGQFQPFFKLSLIL